MFKLVNGYHVPEKDTECIKVVFDITDLLPALKRCRRKMVAVQAGGNFGVWASFLSGHFASVYTFEPDPVNYSALCRNIGDQQNIIKFQAALGDTHGCIGLHTRPENAGAHYVDGSGFIPVLRIDDLALPACDLIVLDIEGYELKALKGAEQTIRNYKPVIHLEDKGLSEKYGTKQGAVIEWLAGLGYDVVERIKRDLIFAARNPDGPSR